MLKYDLRKDNNIIDDEIDVEFARKIIRAIIEIIISNLARNQFHYCKIRIE